MESKSVFFVALQFTRVALDGTHFEGIKRYNSMVILRDFPCNNVAVAGVPSAHLLFFSPVVLLIHVNFIALNAATAYGKFTVVTLFPFLSMFFLLSNSILILCG